MVKGGTTGHALRENSPLKVRGGSHAINYRKTECKAFAIFRMKRNRKEHSLFGPFSPESFPSLVWFYYLPPLMVLPNVSYLVGANWTPGAMVLGWVKRTNHRRQTITRASSVLGESNLETLGSHTQFRSSCCLASGRMWLVLQTFLEVAQVTGCLERFWMK